MIQMAEKKLRVGPIASGSYVYRIGNRVSEARYANSASAWADGRRPQRVNANGRLEPDTDPVDDDLTYNAYLNAVATSRGE